MRSTQIPLFTPDTEWVMPEELKNLKGVKEIAVDLETNDPNLKEETTKQSIQYALRRWSWSIFSFSHMLMSIT